MVVVPPLLADAAGRRERGLILRFDATVTIGIGRSEAVVIFQTDAKGVRG